VDITDAKSTNQLLRHVGTTSTIESNYNPKHDKTFRLSYDSLEAFNKEREHGQVLLRLFDKDKVALNSFYFFFPSFLFSCIHFFLLWNRIIQKCVRSILGGQV
jgi:hypothetical protein